MAAFLCRPRRALALLPILLLLCTAACGAMADGDAGEGRGGGGGGGGGGGAGGGGAGGGATSSREDETFPKEGWTYGNTEEDAASMPRERMKEMAEVDPAYSLYEDMRRQAAAAAAATNAENITRVGSSVVCTSVHDLRAAAKDVLQIGRKRSQYSDGTFECEDYVDYAVACDLDRRETSCNNRYASRMMKNFNRALSVYNCKSYSRIWTCDNCTVAYKRWLCGTVYRKFMTPDTAYHEDGIVREGSTACSCPIMTPEDAVAAPLCVNICNGLPQDCDVAAEPTCPRAACGSAGGAADPGKCSGNIYLDLSSASGTDGFYVGAKIEMVATGQWATIQHYNGYLRMALFEKWNKPFGRETEVLPPPGQGETYRVYLNPNQRGYCRLSERPKMRQGKPCGQSDEWAVDDAQAVNPVVSKLPTIAPVQVSGVDSCPDGTPYNEWQCASPGGFQATDPADGALKDVTYKYPNPLAVEDEGGARCADTEVCVKVDKRSAATPNAPRSGYACCPKSGYSLQGGAVPELWRVYMLKNAGTDAAAGTFSYQCHYGESTTKADAINAVADPAVAKLEGPAAIAKTAISASGCVRNFTGVPDKARDDCVMKTCQPVCYDVERRCPRDIQFKCPDTSDRREYEQTLCNMVVPHGCVMQVQTGTDSSACTQLNPTGYGPLDQKDLDAGSWMKGSAIMGLTASTTCTDRNGLYIDNGRVNPPTAGPTKAKGENQQYSVWCDDGVLPSKLDKGGTKDGKGCREMRYEGFYDESCPRPGYP